VEGRPPLKEEAGNLETVEGISARDVVHFSKRRAGQWFAEAREDELVYSAKRERADFNSEQVFCEFALEFEALPGVFDPGGEKQLDVGVGQPPGSELKRCSRGRVEPLYVVDCDEHGSRRSQELEYREKGQADDVLTHARPVIQRERKSRFECAPLRCRQFGQDVCDVVGEKITQRGEREGRLRSSRPTCEHVVPAFAPGIGAGPPQRRLPDPCGTLQPKSERSRLTVEKSSDPSELRLAADDGPEPEPSFPDCCQRLPPFPERTPGASARQPCGRRRGRARQSMGISPFRQRSHRRTVERVTTYLIEAYVADGDVADLGDRARTAAETMRNEGHAVRYLRSVLVRADETCFHLFEAASEDVVAELAQRAELPYERIVEAEA
jgi:hypothetical protein